MGLAYFTSTLPCSVRPNFQKLAQVCNIRKSPSFTYLVWHMKMNPHPKMPKLMSHVVVQTKRYKNKLFHCSPCEKIGDSHANALQLISIPSAFQFSLLCFKYFIFDCKFSFFNKGLFSRSITSCSMFKK